MGELGALIERDMDEIPAPGFELEAVRRHRERRHRSRRLGSIVVALAVAAIGAYGLVRVFANVRHEIPAIPPPTGTIVFSRQIQPDQKDYLFTVGADGSDERQLMPPSIDVFGISPDGSRVLYADLGADRSTHRANWALPAVVDLDGSDRHLVMRTLPFEALWPETWSPDGTRIVGEGYGPRGSRVNGLYTLSAADGGDLVQVTSTSDRRNDHPIAYSPDGSKILFLRDANDVSNGLEDLYVVDADGSHLLQLNPNGTVLGPTLPHVDGLPPQALFDRRTAAWSPDGSQVCFAAFLGSPGEVHRGVVQRAVFVVDADGTHAHRITPPGQVPDAQWSPDGRWIAFTRAGPNDVGVFLVHPDGTDLHPLIPSEDGLASWGPVWSPDGQHLLVARDADGQYRAELWMVNVDGSGLTRVTDTPAEYFSYGWSPVER
jgi:Tol biopolymer transport system component